ncbi:MAG: PAS domain S-box-containing protein [Maribacter sp.]|jgi:PAS domain S-box-containing protein
MANPIIKISNDVLSKILGIIQGQTFLIPKEYGDYVLEQSIIKRMEFLEIKDTSLFFDVLKNTTEEVNKLAREIVLQDKEHDKIGFRSVFKLNPLGIAITSLGNTIIDVNDAFVKLFGYTENELLGRNFSQLYSSVGADPNILQLNQLMNNEIGVLKINKQYQKKDGTLFMARVWASIFEENGDKLMLSCYQDISEQYEQELETKEREERYRTLFNNSREGIVVIDFSSSVAIDVNPMAIELFGSSRENLLISSMPDQSPEFQPDGQLSSEKISRILAKFKEELTEVSFEWQFKKNDTGTIFDAIVTFAPISLKGEYAAVMFMNDLTERKKAEKKIEQQIKELDKKNKELKHYINSNLELESFAYVASHDLKQPLRSISSFTQLLKRRYQHLFDERAEEYMNFIITNVNNMNELIKDLLDYSRVNTKELDVDEIDMNSLLLDLVDMYHHLPENKGLIFDIQKLPSEFVGNYTKLKQVFQNLINNAIKFQIKGTPPKIEITCEDLVDKYQISIKDNGIGIEQKYMEKIFLVFQRLHTKIEYEGSGIGLAICKKIVEQHGGDIWVESELGKGSTFSFTLKKGLEKLA